jgi:hypothetical protein
MMKRILKVTGLVVVVLVLVLGVHIYMVTRRTPPDANTVALARIDFKEQLRAQDSDSITRWLYRQPGVLHVLCNPAGKLVVFTYAPVSADPDRIAAAMREQLPYDAHRFMPDTRALAGGCPVAQTSVTYKLLHLFK